MPSRIQPEPLPGAFGSGSFSLPCAMRLGEQEIDRGAGAGIGKVGSAAARSPRCRPRRRGRQARSGNAPRASACAAPSSQRLPDSALGGGGDLGQDRLRAASSTVVVEQPVEHFGAAAGRVAQEGREVEGGGEEVLGCALAPKAARRGAEDRLPRRPRRARQACGAPRRRSSGCKRGRWPQQPRRLLDLRSSAAAIYAPFGSGKAMTTDSPGSAGEQDRAARRGTSSPPWRG